MGNRFTKLFGDGDGGNGSWSLKNTVLVDPDKDEIVGERYKTEVAAKAYITTQSPTKTNPWAIKIGGTDSNPITLGSYIRTIGIYGTTRLAGALEGGTMGTDLTEEFIVQDCIISNLAATGMKLISGINCIIEGGTPGGLLVFGYSRIYNCDFSGTAGVYLIYTGVLSANSIINSTGTVECRFCDFSEADIRKGIFHRCYFDGSNTFLATGNFDFENCTIKENMTVAAGATVTMKSGSGKNIVINVGGTLVTDGVLGIIVSGDLTGWTNKGDAYNNVTSGLSAVEQQAAIDELKVLIDGSEGYWSRVGTELEPLNSGDSLKISGNIIAQDVIPIANNMHSLGSPAMQWKDLHLAGGSLFLGGITLTEEGGCLKTSDFHAHGDGGIAGYYKLRQGTSPLAEAEDSHSILWVDSNEELYHQKADGTDEKIVKQTNSGITIQKDGIQSSLFRSNSGDSYVFIDSNNENIETDTSTLILSDAGVHKWRIEKDDSNNFALYDNARAANVLEVVGNGDMTIGTDLDVNGNLSVPKLYLKENGSPTGDSNVYFTERPNVGVRRIMMYGVPQNSAFGFIVAPTTALLANINITLWGSNIDDGGSGNYAQIIFDGADNGNLNFKTATTASLSGDIIFSPDNVEKMRIASAGDVTISSLAGTGNAYVLVDSAGKLYRSTTPL